MLEGICQNTIIDQRTEYIVVKDGKSCVLEDIGENGKTYETLDSFSIFDPNTGNELPYKNICSQILELHLSIMQK